MTTQDRVISRRAHHGCHLLAAILALVFASPPVVTQAGPRPNPAPAPGVSTLLRPFGPARSLRQLGAVATPNLAVFYPFEPDTFYKDNPSVPGDLSDFARPTINSGAYQYRPGPLGDSALRFGFLPPPNQRQINPTFLSVSPGTMVYSLDIISVCTAAAWVFPERLGGRSGMDNLTILSRGATDINNSVSYAFGLDPKGFPFFESRLPSVSNEAGLWRLKATDAVRQNEWHHLCVVFHPHPKIIFYIDGTTATISIPATRYLDRVHQPRFPLFIAARYADDRMGEVRDPFFGCLDDVALWNRMLTWEEIRLLAVDTYAPNRIADFWDMLITGGVRGTQILNPR